ncbi:PREDICTED: regulator of nonsense transcripts UPF3-like isoform X2 [Ipomoea nil]|uniref:regulator of nonsense transcripts UPF3-like isoform X2 n=1 Tax=Ipomoea nil TaxID=35883 RepID=UPI000900CDFE|nr:PREDICTED: regulator of nonsense transcripts UPF3-like isoform X2 [Ipomoea nil]
MKVPLDRAKVVLRHLPPTLPQATLIEKVDSRFSGRYNWVSFHPGKISQKQQTYSRAYVEFKRPEDVIEFAEFFNGHLFVNEKGTQFKTVVEYAPSQRVPKGFKKDGRDGSILKDPEYMEFLEFIEKPVENLPSAEIQLERREAERTVAAKDALIITPLMEYVRQKRAVKTGVRRAVPSGKSTRRVCGASTGSPSSSASKRGSEKRRTSKTMYVPRDSSKVGSGKEKSYILITKRDGQKFSDKSGTSSPFAYGAAPAHGESGSGTADSGRKILLTKGKEKEVPLQNLLNSSAPRPNQRHEASGRIVKSILLKDAHQNQSEHEIQDRDKKPPKPPTMQIFQKDCNGSLEDKVTGHDPHNIHIEKPEKRTRNRDKPDRGVWTPLRRSNSSQASDEPLSLSNQSTEVQDSTEGGHLEIKKDTSIARAGDYRPVGSGRNSHSSADNGTYRHGARRGSAHGMKDADGTSVGEGKPSRRGGPSGYGSRGHEKQVWVQRSSSGS